VTDGEGHLPDNQQTGVKRRFDPLSARFDHSTFRHHSDGVVLGSQTTARPDLAEPQTVSG